MFKAFVDDHSKFALISVRGACTDFNQANDFSHQLADGTWAFSKIPMELDEQWKGDIGSIKYKSFAEANFILLYSEASTNSNILDAHHNRLEEQLTQLFYLLQLQGIVHCDDSHLILGTLDNNQSDICRIAELPIFYPTRGYTSQPVNLVSLEKAASMRKVIEKINKAANEYVRFIRGLNILVDGFKKDIGEERIHQFVRALEGLILPDTGRTKKQFVYRCQTFAKSTQKTVQILNEAFDLRSMSEHLNDWQLALNAHQEDQRENFGLLRTRQMEKLASFAFSRILEDSSIRCHFLSDKEMKLFWQLKETERVKIWGNQLDLDSIG